MPSASQRQRPKKDFTDALEKGVDAHKEADRLWAADVHRSESEAATRAEQFWAERAGAALRCLGTPKWASYLADAAGHRGVCFVPVADELVAIYKKAAEKAKVDAK